MKSFFQIFTAAAAFCSVLAVPLAGKNADLARRADSIMARNAQLSELTKRSEFAEDAIVWIVLAYSDEEDPDAAAPANTTTADAENVKRDALPAEPESDVIVLLVSAYSDEAEGADASTTVEKVKRDALPAEPESDVIVLLVSAYSDEAEGADSKVKRAKRAIVDKLAA